MLAAFAGMGLLELLIIIGVVALLIVGLKRLL